MKLHTNEIAGAPIAVKLDLTMRGGGEFEGTGFCVDCAGKAWLITCRHNVEHREHDFIGDVDLTSVTFGGAKSIEFEGGHRRVVGVSVNGFILDCAAIELFVDEWCDRPKFDADLPISYEGDKPPDAVTIRGPDPAAPTLTLKPTGVIWSQGYAAGSTEPSMVQGVRLGRLPTVVQAWMPSYLPAMEPGFSGGPVLDVAEIGVSLLGVTSHRFTADLSERLPDGRIAEIGMSASACVPIKPLLWALKQAGPGHSIIPVPPPMQPQ